MEQGDPPVRRRTLKSDPDAQSEIETSSTSPNATSNLRPWPRPPGPEPRGVDESTDAPRTLQLREEQLVARKEMLEVGEVVLRTELDDVPSRLEVDAFREEIEIEHEPIGKVVSERTDPWEEDGALVIPIYEEQLVAVKRLVLREQLRVRRVRNLEHQVFEDTLRRERLVVEDPSNTGLVYDRYPLAEGEDVRGAEHEDQRGVRGAREQPGFLGNLVRRALQ